MSDAAFLNSPAVSAAIALIWREAELLDRKDYKAWLTLWSDEGYYVIPIDQTTTDYAASLNYVYDDQAMRIMRVERMSGGFSASASDAARTVRNVSRFVVGGIGKDSGKDSGKDGDGDIVELRSSQIVVANKRGVTTLFAADLTHRIKVSGGEARIIDKVIRIIDSAEALSAIGFLL